jgi:dolichol-phosphate mannosyltransferase
MDDNSEKPAATAPGWTRDAAVNTNPARSGDITSEATRSRTRLSLPYRLLTVIDRVSGGRADWVVRFFSYAIVGGTAAVVNLICFSLLYYKAPIDFGSGALAHTIHYIVVFALAAEISTITNFAINDRITFSRLSGHARPWIVRCLRFHLTTVVGTLITFIISFSLARLGVVAVLAQATAIGIAFLVNFTLHHVFTYRRLQAPVALNPHQLEGSTDGTSDRQSTASGERGGSEGSVANPASVTEKGSQTLHETHAEGTHPWPPLLRFSILIPAHDEDEALRPTISRLYRTLADEHVPFEILVINDHSTDRTEVVLQQLSYEFPGVRYVNNERPGGFGRAIQTGLEHFAGDAVCIVMADASDDPRDVMTYYRKLLEGYECVFGSRFMAGSKVIDYPRHKLFVNRLANWFINILFQLHFNDTTNAFKAYRREVIAGVMPLLAQHFNITVELPLKAITRGYTYTTVPINWYNRATGVSKLKIQEMGSRYLFIVLYVWLEQLLSRGDYRRPAATEASLGQPQALIREQREATPQEVVSHSVDIETQDMMPAGTASGSHQLDSAAIDTARDPIAVARARSPEDSGMVSSPSRPRVSPLMVWSASLALVLLGLTVYGRAIHILPLSDDWGLLDTSRLGPQYVFFVTANYHYNPVVHGVLYVVYLLFGVNPVPYHVVALLLFSVILLLILRLGWRLTGSFTVGVLASLLFVLSGRQYEGIVWTLVSIFQVLGLALYLGGLLFYLQAQEVQGRRRLWMLCGFYVCMVLAVFSYEQEATLVVACMLYRFVVIEHGRGFGVSELRARARTWGVEFGFPVAFFVAYLGLKVWMGHQIGRSQAPGLSVPVSATVPIIVIALYQSFLPGILTGKLLTLQDLLLQSLSAGHIWGRLVSFAKVLLPLGVVILFAKPVYRWLVLWSLLVVTSTVLGIGYSSSRYQLLFVVPAVILWAGFLVWLAKKTRDLILRLVQRRQASREHQRMVIPALAWLPVIALIVIYGGLGLQYTAAQLSSWQRASDIEGAAIHRIASLGAVHPMANILYLVNVPDNLTAPADPSGHFEHGAYLFQDGAATMVELSVPGRFQGVDYLRTPDYHAIGTPEVVSRAEVNTLTTNPDNLVVCFSSQTQQIEVWGPLCT